MAYNNVKVKARQTVTQSSTQTDKLGTVSEVPMGEWNINTPYKKLNKVRYVSTGGSGVTLLAKKANQGVEPFISNGWQEVWMVENYDGGAVIPNGTYPDMTVGNATNAQNDGTGTNIANQFAEVAQDIQGLRDDVTNESHFRGMFESVEALRAAYPTATPNDYAYIVGGNIYIWQNDAWQDSGEPSPNTAVPASNSIPLMDGVGNAGTSYEYARGDHRHPSDTNKVNKSGDTISGNLTVDRGVLTYHNGNNNTSFELGKYGSSGIEFHSQNAADGVSLDYDAFIQANSPTSETAAGSAQLVYSARQHVFDGPITANSDNNFLAHGNEFNFVGKDYNSSMVWFNYRGGNIGSYLFGSGRANGSVADIYAGSIFDHSERVYSPNNLQPIIDAYKVGFLSEQSNSSGWVVINDGHHGNKIAIQFGMFTNAGTITFAKPFIMVPFVLTSPNDSSDIQTRRVAVKQVEKTYFITYSTGSYAGRYIAVGQI